MLETKLNSSANQLNFLLLFESAEKNQSVYLETDLNELTHLLKRIKNYIRIRALLKRFYTPPNGCQTVSEIHTVTLTQLHRT